MPDLDLDEFVASKLATVLDVDRTAEVQCDGRDVTTLEPCTQPAAWYIVCSGPELHRFDACRPHQALLATVSAQLSPALREAKLTCGYCNAPWDLIDGWQLL